MPRVTPGAREEDAAIVNERNNMHMKRLHALIPLGAVDAQVAKLLARTFSPPLYNVRVHVALRKYFLVFVYVGRDELPPGWR